MTKATLEEIVIDVRYRRSRGENLRTTIGDIVWPSLLMLDFLIFARRLRDPMKLLNHSSVLIGTHTSALYVDGDALPCPENGQRNDLF